MTEVLKSETATEELLDNLLQWMTNANATGELTSLEGISSGRQVAQVLSTLEPQFFGDELAVVANIDDDDISNERKEQNHELIAKKLAEYFQRRKRYIENSELWRIVPYEIAVNENKEKILRLLIIVVAVVIFSGHKSYQTGLANNPPDVQAKIATLANDFDESTKAITNGELNPNEVNQYRTAAEKFKLRALELEKENGKLTAQNKHLTDANEHLEQEVKRILEEKLQNTEAAQRQKHLEAQVNEATLQIRKAEERVTELEAENDILRITTEELEQEKERLLHAQTDLTEENDSYSHKNAELLRELSKANSKLEQLTQKETHSARTKNYENELLQKRITSLVEELSQQESLRNQYDVLKSMQQNAQKQVQSLQEKLEETTARANNSEAEVMALKKQIKRIKEQSAVEAVANTASDVPSLHDELSGSMSTLSRSDSDEQPLADALELTNLKTQLEMALSNNARLTEELKETTKLLEKAQNNSESKLATHRTQSEYMEQEKDRLQRELSDFKSRDAASKATIGKLEEAVANNQSRMDKLEAALNSSRIVIETITTSTNGSPSPTEFMELQNENQNLRNQVDNLTQHLDRFQHMATQEQRLITASFAQQQLQFAQFAHGPGFTGLSKRVLSDSTPSSSTPSAVPPDPQFRPPSSNSTHSSGLGRRSFLSRQLDASMQR